jgi:hypothetical protein
MRTGKLSELIDRLIDIRDELEGSEDPDPPVRLALQPHYPISFPAAGVALERRNGRDYDDLDPEEQEIVDEVGEEEGKTTVWIVQGGQDDDFYRVPRDVWDRAAAQHVAMYSQFPNLDAMIEHDYQPTGRPGEYQCSRPECERVIQITVVPIYDDPATEAGL